MTDIILSVARTVRNGVAWRGIPWLLLPPPPHHPSHLRFISHFPATTTPPTFSLLSPRSQGRRVVGVEGPVNMVVVCLAFILFMPFLPLYPHVCAIVVCPTACGLVCCGCPACLACWLEAFCTVDPLCPTPTPGMVGRHQWEAVSQVVGVVMVTGRVHLIPHC